VLDLDSAESGFSWYQMSKLEHQLVNIRHIQHHGAQLADRLRSAADIASSGSAADLPSRQNEATVSKPLRLAINSVLQRSRPRRLPVALGEDG